MGVRYIGAKVERQEDPRLLTGHGRYVDDIKLPGMLHACFLRSSFAHARINGIDAASARRLPGVHGVFTLADLGESYAGKRMQQLYPAPLIKQDITPYPLAKDEVSFVGQPVAVVVADSRAVAEDAVALIEVDYEPLDAVADLRRAAEPDAPRAHAGAPDNLAAQLRARYSDADGAFAAAPHVLSTSFLQHRGGCHSMETRGVVAAWSPFGDQLSLWSATQVPYLIRRALAGHLGMAETDIRVIAPDVGGGFGPKAGFYPEEIVVPLAARRLGRPVKWIEDRREHFYSTNTQRDQFWELEIAADADGRVLAVRGRCLHDNGAFMNYGLLLPFTTMAPLPGPYAIKNLDVTLDAVFTNTTPNSPIRGAGRPNAAFAMERVMETVARALELDPAEVRRRNFVPADAFPYATGQMTRTGTPVTYDSGDYHAVLEKALALADYAGFPARQAEARRQGRYLGIGISSCVEDTGLGPYEGAAVQVEPTGNVLIRTGAASQGQGHATVFAQIAADVLGIAIERVRYESADTGAFPLGVGTVASRVALNMGPAVFAAAGEVRQKALRLAAELLEVAEADLEIDDGQVHVKGVPDMKISLGEIALKLSPMLGGSLPKGFTAGLEATSFQSSEGMAYANGTNVAEVEVDIGTGAVKLLRYSVAHDCGRMLNPMLVDGQIIGGVVHGISNALYEQMIYDDQGQPLTTNYGEYPMALSSEMPHIDIVHHETPSPLNPLGIKGAGEGGTIPAIAAVVNAIENALAPFGVVIDRYPVTPQYLSALIDAAPGPGSSPAEAA
jgi:aerobic carbon-monoxide dehydrogenase large subunit